MRRGSDPLARQGQGERPRAGPAQRRGLRVRGRQGRSSHDGLLDQDRRAQSRGAEGVDGSQENVEIVRQLIQLGEQVRHSELPPPHTDLVTLDAEIDMSRRVFSPGVYRGFEGWARLNRELREVW